MVQLTRCPSRFQLRSVSLCIALWACAGGEPNGSDEPDAEQPQGRDTSEQPPVAPAQQSSSSAPRTVSPTAVNPATDESPGVTTLFPGASPDAGSTTGGPAPSSPPPADGALVRGADPTVESATTTGPFEVQTVTTGLRDGPGYGSQTLHVPVGAEPPFAGVAIVPGFVSPESSIRAWGPFLASHGIVVLTIGTNSGGDSPDVRARALIDALETLRSENERPGSPLVGAMALDRLGVMGWSMGGG